MARWHRFDWEGLEVFVPLFLQARDGERHAGRSLDGYTDAVRGSLEVGDGEVVLAFYRLLPMPVWSRDFTPGLSEALRCIEVSVELENV